MDVLLGLHKEHVVLSQLTGFAVARQALDIVILSTSKWWLAPFVIPFVSSRLFAFVRAASESNVSSDSLRCNSWAVLGHTRPIVPDAWG